MAAPVALRKPEILPFFNTYTILGLVAWAFFWLIVNLNIILEPTDVQSIYMLLLIQMVPIIISFTRHHFTYISFIMINHMVTLSIPKWFQFQGFAGVPKPLSRAPDAVQEYIFCTVLMILVYYGCRVMIFNFKSEKEKYQFLTIKKWQLMILGSYVIFVPIFIFQLPSWFLTVHFLLLSADVIMLFTSNCPGNEVYMKWIKIGAILEAFEYFLHTGMMTLMGSLISFTFLISCMEKKYWRVFFIGILVVCLSAIQSVKGNYRIALRDNPDFSLKERIVVLYELLALKYWEHEEIEEVEDDGKETGTDKLLSGFMRAGDDSMERVLEYTPERVPFWNGETYASIPFMFIPRALWPDKPSRHFWNKYGRQYGVLSTNDHETSVGVGYLAEGYMNFGYGGMYVVAILVGFLIAICEKIAHLVLNGYFYFPYIILVTPLLAPGGDLGSMMQSLWILLMFLFGMRPFLLNIAKRDDYG